MILRGNHALSEKSYLYVQTTLISSILFLEKTLMFM